jgi:hypothetical protein
MQSRHFAGLAEKPTKSLSAALPQAKSKGRHNFAAEYQLGSFPDSKSAAANFISVGVLIWKCFGKKSRAMS